MYDIYELKTKEELLEDKKYYEHMKKTYSKGASHWLKKSIIADAEKHLEIINGKLKKFK